MIIILLLIIAIMIAILCAVLMRSAKLKKLSVICGVLFIVLMLWTFNTGYLPSFSSNFDRNIVFESISSKITVTVNELNKSFSKSYTVSDDNGEYHSVFTLYMFSTEQNSEKTISNISKKSILNTEYYSGLDLSNKVLVKIFVEIFTKHCIYSDNEFCFFPSLSVPFNPNSFFLKGCTYSEEYINAFAWSADNNLYIIIEQCDSEIGKTDKEHYLSFIDDLVDS